jgi:hypothetical protein
VKAVTLILKHATLLRTSNLPEAALTNADLDYQRQNIDESIQQYLTACASDVSVDQFANFIMDTEIGRFILFLFVTSIPYCPFSVISVLSHYRCIDDTCHTPTTIFLFSLTCHRCPGYTFLFQNQHCNPITCMATSCHMTLALPCSLCNLYHFLAPLFLILLKVSMMFF